MSWKKLVRNPDQTLGWCPGCGLNSLFYVFCRVLAKLKVKPVIVSGIGCTGRGAGYFNLDSIHGLHGRAVPLAVGIKRGNPKLKVVVFSGDGDLLGIGLGHLLHAARRNEKISVICNRNEVFGMTGGQASPTTRLGGITKTTPEGNPYPPLNIQKMLLANDRYFYARTSPVFLPHLEEVLEKALKYPGFSYVDVLSPCLVNFARRNYEKAGQVFQDLKDNYRLTKTNRRLKDNELGVTSK